MNSSFDWFKYNRERNKEAIKINLPFFSRKDWNFKGVVLKDMVGLQV